VIYSISAVLEVAVTDLVNDGLVMRQ
jgi:hypothetical protein